VKFVRRSCYLLGGIANPTAIRAFSFKSLLPRLQPSIVYRTNAYALSGVQRHGFPGAAMTLPRVTSAVAPVSDSPGALGRVKAPFADAHRCGALTRPAHSQVICNYRIDGGISDADLSYAAK
jgi:hypothetical protein